MDCDECGNKMTLLLLNYVCDWCDGKVEKEWAAEQITEPYASPKDLLAQGTTKKQSSVGCPGPFGFSLINPDDEDDDFDIADDYWLNNPDISCTD